MLFQNNDRTFEILLIEDNPGDVRLIAEAFKECRRQYRLNVVKDGEQALAYLLGEGGYAGAARPDAIILDLNVPRVDGRQVLASIKKDDRFRSIPAIVLTTSLAEEDVRTAYRNHANCYVAKPRGLDELFALIQAIENFWFTYVVLPSNYHHDER